MTKEHTKPSSRKGTVPPSWTADEIYLQADLENHRVTIPKPHGHEKDLQVIVDKWGAHLCKAEAWIDALIKSKGPLFRKVSRKRRRFGTEITEEVVLATPLGRYVVEIPALREAIARIGSITPINSVAPTPAVDSTSLADSPSETYGLWSFSEKITLLLDACKKFDFHKMWVSRYKSPNEEISVPEAYAEAAERMAAYIREQAASRAFKSKLRSRMVNSQRNEKAGRAYFKSLLANVTSRLLTVRIDLFYDPTVYRGHKPIDEVLADRVRLINNLRKNKRLARDLVGSIWKLETGEIRGPHFHFVFFFDGHKVQDDVYAGMELGRYWQEFITEGKGRFFLCNADKEKYAHLGIGMIEHHDLQKQENFLRYVLQYMTKKDQYVKVKLSKKCKVFDHGEMPAPRTEQRGRPRKAVMAEEQLAAAKSA